MLSVRGLEVQIKFWRACFRDSGPFDQYIKSQQDMDKKGKMGVHQYRRAWHPIKSYLQTLKDNILKAEKDKAMKDLGQQNHYISLGQQNCCMRYETFKRCHITEIVVGQMLA